MAHEEASDLFCGIYHQIVSRNQSLSARQATGEIVATKAASSGLPSPSSETSDQSSGHATGVRFWSLSLRQQAQRNETSRNKPKSRDETKRNEARLIVHQHYGGHSNGFAQLQALKSYSFRLVAFRTAAACSLYRLLTWLASGFLQTAVVCVCV